MVPADFDCSLWRVDDGPHRHHLAPLRHLARPRPSDLHLLQPPPQRVREEIAVSSQPSAISKNGCHPERSRRISIVIWHLRPGKAFLLEALLERARPYARHGDLLPRKSPP